MFFWYFEWLEETIWHAISTYVRQFYPQSACRLGSLILSGGSISLLICALVPSWYDPPTYLVVKMVFYWQSLLIVGNLVHERGYNVPDFTSKKRRQSHCHIITDHSTVPFKWCFNWSFKINSKHICTFSIINVSQRENTNTLSPGASPRYHYDKQQVCAINNKWSKWTHIFLVK